MNKTVKFPRLLGENGEELARLEPSTMGVTLNMSPVHTAFLTLPTGSPTITARQWMELYGPDGSFGYFRVSAVNTVYGSNQHVTLEHGLCTLADASTAPIVPATTEPGDKVPDKGDTPEQETTEQKISGTPRSILTRLLSYQGDVRWQLGEAPDTGSYTIEGQNTNVLSCIVNLLGQLPNAMLVTDQSTSPWTLNLTEVESTPSCECRLTRNMDDMRVNMNTSELYTHIICPRLTAGYMEADTIGKWGKISYYYSMPDNVTRAEAARVCGIFLENHKNPKLSISISAWLLAEQTGEPMDALGLGRMCRVALPDYGVTYNERIVSMSYPDLVKQPQKVTLTLAAKTQDATATLVEIKQGGGGGGGGGVKAEQEELKTRITDAEIRIDRAEAQILLRAYESVMEDTRERLRYAGISLSGTAADVTLLASQTEVTELGSSLQSVRIDLDALEAALQLEVQDNNNVVSLRLDAMENSITGKADKIELQGYVTVTELEAEQARIAALESSAITAETLSASMATLDTIYAPGAGLQCNTITALGVITLGETYVDDIYGTGASFDSIVVGGEPVATQAWIGEQGYLKSVPADLTSISSINGVSLSGTYVATRKWVEDRGYLTGSPASFSTTNLSATTFNLNDTHVDWQAKTVVTSLDVSNGSIQNIPVVQQVHYNTETIHYLGY